MYNTLIKILKELKRDSLVNSCIKCMKKALDKSYDLKWAGKSTESVKLINDTKERLMCEYPIYRQYVLCCLLIAQWDYGHFDTVYKAEVNNFIKTYERKNNYEQKHKTKGTESNEK